MILCTLLQLNSIGLYGIYYSCRFKNDNKYLTLLLINKCLNVDAMILADIFYKFSYIRVLLLEYFMINFYDFIIK